DLGAADQPDRHPSSDTSGGEPQAAQQHRPSPNLFGLGPRRLVDAGTVETANLAVLRRHQHLDRATKVRIQLIDPDAMRHSSADPVRAAETARANAHWWRDLDEDLRRAVIDVYPEQVGNAEGLPPRVRDEANRRVLKDVLARERANRFRLFKPITRLEAV